jgi:ATP-dependent helicase/nuclease subunit A
LRAGGIAAPVQAEPNAVRLLTIHGAKGLEAPLVLLLDTDGEPVKSETMGVLVDWPGEASHPRRFVFLASESDPPSCVADALATEQAARSREELNALYVAMTRTRQTLVVSSMAPRVQNPGSWWARLQAHAQEATGLAAADLGAGATPDAKVDSVTLRVLPLHTSSAPFGARNPMPAGDPLAVQTDRVEDESLESRIGSAMHLLLEWVNVRRGGVAQPYAWSTDRTSHVAAQFLLDADQVAAACDMARGILDGEGAWTWDADQLLWHGNEVPIVYRGRMLRLDRLVQHKATGHWWVLDYKSNSQPHLQPELRAQLLDYRAAVALAQSAPVVQAAFLTPQGALLTIEQP